MLERPSAKDGFPNASEIEIPGVHPCRAFVCASHVELGSLVVRHRNFLYFDLGSCPRPRMGPVRCIPHCLFRTQVVPTDARHLGGHYGSIERWYTVDQTSMVVVAVPTRFVWFLQWTLRCKDREMRARYLDPQAYFLEVVWPQPEDSEDDGETVATNNWHHTWENLGEVWDRLDKSPEDWQAMGESVPGQWDRLNTLYQRF